MAGILAVLAGCTPPPPPPSAARANLHKSQDGEDEYDNWLWKRVTGQTKKNSDDNQIQRTAVAPPAGPPPNNAAPPGNYAQAGSPMPANFQPGVQQAYTNIPPGNAYPAAANYGPPAGYVPQGYPAAPPAGPPTNYPPTGYPQGNYQPLPYTPPNSATPAPPQFGYPQGNPLPGAPVGTNGYPDPNGYRYLPPAAQGNGPPGNGYPPLNPGYPPANMSYPPQPPGYTPNGTGGLPAGPASNGQYSNRPTG